MKHLEPMLCGILIVSLAGCSGPAEKVTGPSPVEIESYVKSQVPVTLRVQSFTLGSATKSGTAWTVAFAAVVAPKETLYAPVDLDVELGKLGWKRSVRGEDAPKPVLIKPVQEPANALDITGQVVAEQANGWQFRDLTWSLDQPSLGQPRSTFVPEALLWRSPDATDPVYHYVRSGMFDKLPLRTGATYQDVQLDSFMGDSALLMHARGNCQVKFDELPPVLQEFFHRGALQAKATAAARSAKSSRQPPPPEPARPVAVAAAPATEPRPEPPPSNTDTIIGEYLRQVTTSRNTINVRTQSPVYDEFVLAWKVECEYSFYLTDSRSAGGKRYEGKGYAWFRDKLVVRWRDIVPPRTAFD